MQRVATSYLRKFADWFVFAMVSILLLSASIPAFGYLYAEIEWIHRHVPPWIPLGILACEGLVVIIAILMTAHRSSSLLNPAIWRREE